jgi:hypothetical protein
VKIATHAAASAATASPGGQPLNCAGGRTAGGAQDAADADETQHGHLDGMPATSGSGKLFQPVSGRGGRVGNTSFIWLHMSYLPQGHASLHRASRRNDRLCMVTMLG